MMSGSLKFESWNCTKTLRCNSMECLGSLYIFIVLIFSKVLVLSKTLQKIRSFKVLVMFFLL